jgi:uncharacterized protein YbjT (DUF2867 family)
MTRVAVVGATGYIGTRLVPRLAEAGYQVRCLVRTPNKLRDRPWRQHPAIEVAQCDLTDRAGLAEQLAGCAAAYYLVHAMQAGADFAAVDRDLAAAFAKAAAAAGLRRIIYLGGLGDADDRLSPHLASRREVEQVLASGPTPVTTLRAAMIIGSGSASFEILRYLTERLPVMITPRWVRTVSQPIAIRNVLHYLVHCLSVGETTGRVLEIGGPDLTSYEQLIHVMAEERGLRRRLIVPVPLLTPKLSSLWMHLVTPVDARMAKPLAEGLRNRVVINDDLAARLMPQPLLSVREAIRIALDAEARFDVESSWSTAGPVPGDPDWAGGDVFEDSRSGVIAATPERVFAVLQRLGGRSGWFKYNQLWRLRGWLDRIVGGPGTTRSRRHPDTLWWGDTLDFWRVVEIERPSRLTLRAEMRVPGDAILDFELQPVEGDPASTRLIQTARFRPRGLPGLAYWYAVAPFHKPVFDGLFAGVARAASEAK